jgi:hypothetical protein
VDHSRDEPFARPGFSLNQDWRQTLWDGRPARDQSRQFLPDRLDGRARPEELLQHSAFSCGADVVEGIDANLTSAGWLSTENRRSAAGFDRQGLGPIEPAGFLMTRRASAGDALAVRFDLYHG